MTKHFSIKFIAVVAIAIFIGIGQAFAQSTVTGGINGKITDPQGAIVPNASVTITNTGTNSTVTVNATDDGTYKVTNLQPGKYRVEASVSGFAPAKAENIVVEVGQSTTVDMPLTLGTATAEVQVTAEAPVINTNDNANALNINQTSINELPINGRRWSNFALLTPSAVPDGNFGLISFRGISGLLNNNTIDG
ncbi:MAG TPA: carboxypeptidase-like regulatory domain-containing protein, partial [Pyrinomonadaceae bacterium]|nr:carboxypeptidase-like regulatory domain-containing protein [Pyrinomonadaceae bacterium]